MNTNDKKHEMDEEQSPPPESPVRKLYRSLGGDTGKPIGKWFNSEVECRGTYKHQEFIPFMPPSTPRWRAWLSLMAEFFKNGLRRYPRYRVYYGLGYSTVLTDMSGKKSDMVILFNHLGHVRSIGPMNIPVLHPICMYRCSSRGEMRWIESHPQFIAGRVSYKMFSITYVCGNCGGTNGRHSDVCKRNSESIKQKYPNGR